MASTRVRLAACALSAGLLIPAGLVLPATSALPGSAVLAADTDVTFEYAKEHVKPVSLDFDGITAKIWTVTTGIDELNGAREFAFYGEFDFPTTAQDVGIEEFESNNYLPWEENSVVVNGGLRSRVEWEKSDDKYMNRVFHSDSKLYSRQDTFTLKINGVSHEVNIPAKSAELNTTPLENALNEHWNDYQSALSSGMEFDQASLDAYLAADKHARDLVATVGTANPPTQEALDAERVSLNEVATALKPKPFDRGPITEAIAKADALLANNGKDGKRLTLEDYGKIVAARSHAAGLAATADLQTILVPGEGGPLVTHRNFTSAVQSLNDLLANPKYESYEPADVAELTKIYDEAIARVPSAGKGFEAASRDALLEQIDEARGVLLDAVYATPQIVSAEIAGLKNALDSLKEVDLGAQYNLRVTYQHPMKNGPTSLIQEYFVNDAGARVEENLPVAEGQEVRWSITNPVIKFFADYKPSSFHLNADDGSHRFVRVLTNSRGEQVVAFRVTATNQNAGASLAIRYVEGRDTRFDAPEADEQELPGGQGAAPAAAPAQNSDGKTGAEKPVKEAKGMKKGVLANTGASVLVLGGLMSALLAGGALALRARRKF